MKQCGICGNFNDRANNYCTHCGNRIAMDNFCPFCGELNSDESSYCSNCNKQIRPVSIDSFEKLFTDYNKFLLANAEISDGDYMDILSNIFKKLSFSKIVGNTPKEKILSLASVFAECRPKSQGFELGHEMGHVLHYDERLDDSVQIATIIHELTHFLLFDIIESLLCKIFHVKHSYTLEGFVWYCLSNDLALMNEYCAASVSKRFIPFGYHDYRSFNLLCDENEYSGEEIMMSAVLGNAFSNEIIVHLEYYIDHNLRESIKLQYKKDLMSPTSTDAYFASGECIPLDVKNTLILNDLFKIFEECFDINKWDDLESIKEGIENRV